MNRAEIIQLLRIAADDELTADQARDLQAHLAAHPEDREFIVFERQLRSAVGRAMGDVAAPAELRESVRSQVAAPSLPLRLVGSSVSTSVVAGPAPTRRLFVPSGLAAGFLLLVGSAVVIGLTGNADWFDWFRSSTVAISNGGSLGFPIDEHQRCAVDPDYARRKFTFQTQAQLREHFADQLHWDVAVPDLSLFGFSFEVAGNCSAGSGAQSVHLRYTDGSTTVSVWIEQSRPSDLTHSARFEEGHAYLVTPTNRQALRDAQTAYYAWRAGEFVYRIVPAAARESREMAVAIGMPDVRAEEIH